MCVKKTIAEVLEEERQARESAGATGGAAEFNEIRDKIRKNISKAIRRSCDQLQVEKAAEVARAFSSLQ